jgi:hypothetical protein
VASGVAVRGGCLLLLAGAMPTPRLAAQVPGRYVEVAATEIAVGTGEARRERTLRRRAEYDVHRAGDTVVVQATELDLTQASGAEVLHADTDGFVGGRWRLVSDSRGDLIVVERPFVPPAVLDLSDLAAIMDDFFPGVPPPLAVGDSAVDGSGRTWRRLADSTGLQRHAWSAAETGEAPQRVADSLAAVVRESTSEHGTGSWDGLGVVAWQREIRTHTAARIEDVEVVADVVARTTVHRTTP